jgi:hypothetical protein
MDSIAESDSVAESLSTGMCGSGPRALTLISRVLLITHSRTVE